jgi:hypothetical protein
VRPKPKLYSTALDTAQYADEQGVDVIVLFEHYGVEDGCLPAPEVLAGGSRHGPPARPSASAPWCCHCTIRSASPNGLWCWTR